MPLAVYYILLFRVFMAVFFTLGVVPDHKPSEVADDTKKFKMRKSCNSVLNAGALSIKNATKCFCTSLYGPPCLSYVFGERSVAR